MREKNLEIWENVFKHFKIVKFNNWGLGILFVKNSGHFQKWLTIYFILKSTIQFYRTVVLNWWYEGEPVSTNIKFGVSFIWDCKTCFCP